MLALLLILAIILLVFGVVGGLFLTKILWVLLVVALICVLFGFFNRSRV